MKGILCVQCQRNCFLQPLLTEEELAVTKREVEEFSRPGGVGETLQQKLLERAASRESWVSSVGFASIAALCMKLYTGI